MATTLRRIPPPPPPPLVALARAPLFQRAQRTAGTSASFAMLRFFLFLIYANVALWLPALEMVRPAQIAAIAASLLLVYEGMSGRRRLGLVWPESPLLLAFIAAAFLSVSTALWQAYALTTSLELAKC